MKNKYGAKKTKVDGIIFDSRKEAARYKFIETWIEFIKNNSDKGVGNWNN